MENYTIPENIYVDGKFVPNVNKIQVPVFKKPAREGFYNPTNWATNTTGCGKTPDEMYKYLFPK
jgi:hypothetical protein